MTRAWAILVCLLCLPSCSGTQTSKTCSDATYAALIAECSAAAVGCRQRGGEEAECGAICDEKADDWAQRCGQ